MKWVATIIFLIISFLAATPPTATSETSETVNQPFTWSRFWHDLKDDWIHVGKEAKETGTEMGYTVKDEFKAMPENLREGMNEATRDFQEMTGMGRDTED